MGAFYSDKVLSPGIKLGKITPSASVSCSLNVQRSLILPAGGQINCFTTLVYFLLYLCQMRYHLIGYVNLNLIGKGGFGLGLALGLASVSSGFIL